MNVQSETEVGRIAREHPISTRVFHRYGIDYCCGGGLSLAEACGRRGLDAKQLVDEIRREIGTETDALERWDERPLHDLLTHILVAYHRPLYEELGRLETMARKVLEVHREKEPEMLPELLSVYLGLKAELEQHMGKEEQILFPMIESGQGAFADGPIAVMRDEHDEAASALARLRELTHDYAVRPDACTTWRALWHGLETLEESLHEHIHLENNILFPRALEG